VLLVAGLRGYLRYRRPAISVPPFAPGAVQRSGGRGLIATIGIGLAIAALLADVAGLPPRRATRPVPAVDRSPSERPPE
jgi:hypothetical protein